MIRKTTPRVTPIALAVLLAACSKPAEPTADAAPAATPPAEPPAAVEAAPVATTWPASLNVLGEGFPNPGDACRRLGESEATVDFLDHTATLAGCPNPEAANALGGTIVGTVEGITLVSVPTATATPGDGDGQGDAVVAGTAYNATAQVRCSGYQGAGEGLCDAGVVRGAETGPYVEVTLPDGRLRTIFFNADGSFLTFSTAEADGTAAMPISATRDGDLTIATLGTERYEIPDVFVRGD